MGVSSAMNLSLDRRDGSPISAQQAQRIFQAPVDDPRGNRPCTACWVLRFLDPCRKETLEWTLTRVSGSRNFSTCSSVSRKGILRPTPGLLRRLSLTFPASAVPDLDAQSSLYFYVHLSLCCYLSKTHLGKTSSTSKTRALTDSKGLLLVDITANLSRVACIGNSL
ncbi:hypothetical protein QR685DRAFT_314309 [Neurospora intermedia]|uniref:Uncharacterized protein n=1 Tax=Neurospora intermedia TaxID=5142 RepID=A0ABR3D7W4_NEUIN